jgi:hypothetical protein
MGGEQLPRASKYQKSRKLFITSESKSLFSCPVLHFRLVEDEVCDVAIEDEVYYS